MTVCASSLSSCGTLWRSKRVTSFTFCVSVYKSKKKNNHKKAHQRLIEKSLVRLHLRLSRAQTTPAPVITSPVARRSHQLALEAVALIAFAQPGQASQAALLPTLLPYALPMVYSNFTTLNCNILKSKSNHTSDFYVVCRGQLLNYSIIFLFIIRT